jgi:hypothetical protein
MTSTTREVAEQITADLGYQGGWQNQQALTEAIDKALQAERENAAKIMDDTAALWKRHFAAADHRLAQGARDKYLACVEGAAAIREGKPPE